MEEANPLQALLLERMIDLNMSARAVVAKTDGQVSYATLRSVVRGEKETVSLRIAHALATALDLSVVDLIATGGVVG